MKSIEERANKFALEKHPYSPFYEEYTKMYIEIATEQKAIDDEQLPLIKETYYNAGYETAKNKMIDKACEWLRKQYPPYMEYDLILDAMLDNFKKAMEE